MVDIIPFMFVFLIGIIASFIGSIVGSGGLISIPFLIFMGLPPHIAIATNKFGGIGLSLGAIPKFWKARKIIWKYVLTFAIISTIGAMIGANILLTIDKEILKKIVGTIIILIIPFIFFKKDIGIKKKETTKTKRVFGYFIYFIIMIFGGFFGGGAGTLMLYTLTIFFGFTIVEANATDIIPWFLLSLSSLIIFAMNGIVNYPFGIALFFGMLIGGNLGAHTAIKKGDQWVKTLFVVVVIISGIKLVFF